MPETVSFLSLLLKQIVFQLSVFSTSLFHLSPSTDYYSEMSTILWPAVTLLDLIPFHSVNYKLAFSDGHQ